MRAAGIFGVVRNSVAQRTREIGIRMALGAGPGSVAGLIVRQLAPWAAVGVAAGVAGALTVGRLLEHYLFHVGARDPLTLAAAAVAPHASIRRGRSAANDASRPNQPPAATSNCSCGNATGERRRMGKDRLELLQGTLDVMVLQTLAGMGSLHGYGIARRIEQVSGEEVLLNQGTIYASLVRLQQRGWISAEWGVSDNNRKAKFYAITRHGRKRLAQDAAYWRRLSDLMGRVLAGEEQ
ncbi:MAG TPA: PadR family transcriptional regulator [Candidatus Sulfopaludibacter sp.]|nr:PadR family transcriptional regulator [Candidatus Sulfopaludibacter sp.]